MFGYTRYGNPLLRGKKLLTFFWHHSGAQREGVGVDFCACLSSLFSVVLGKKQHRNIFSRHTGRLPKFGWILWHTWKFQSKWQLCDICCPEPFKWQIIWTFIFNCNICTGFALLFCFVLFCFAFFCVFVCVRVCVCVWLFGGLLLFMIIIVSNLVWVETIILQWFW